MVNWAELPDDVTRRIALQGMSGPGSYGFNFNEGLQQLDATRVFDAYEVEHPYVQNTFRTWYPRVNGVGDVVRRGIAARFAADRASGLDPSVSDYWPERIIKPNPELTQYFESQRERLNLAPPPRQRAFNYVNTMLGAAAVGGATAAYNALFKPATDTADTQMYRAEDSGKKPTKAVVQHSVPETPKGVETMSVAPSPIGDTTPR